jgi:hypothetical protein
MSERKMLSYQEIEEVMEQIKSEELKQELDQVITVFRLMNCRVEGYMEVKESIDKMKHLKLFTLDFTTEEKYICSISFMSRMNETHFNEMDIVGTKHRELKNEFLVAENNGIIASRIGGITVRNKSESEVGYSKMIEVLKRLQLLQV